MLFFRKIFNFCSFNNLQIHDSLKEQLNALKIKKPSPIQKLSINILKSMKYQNYYMAAQTGTGKTLAYLLPIISLLKENTNKKALIIAPTKELSKQIEKECLKLKFVNIYNLQGKINNLQNEEIYNKHQLFIGNNLNQIQIQKNLLFCVIDEIDSFIEFGFKNELKEKILEIQNQETKGIFVSANYNKQLNYFFQETFQQRNQLKLILEQKTNQNLENIEHEFAFHENEIEKKQNFQGLIKEFKNQRILVFANSNISINDICKLLQEIKYTNYVIYNGTQQTEEREQSLDKFQKQQAKIMISTNLASKGLDFPFLKYVINFDFPINGFEYINRAGRTGRAGKNGTVISLYGKQDVKLVEQIEMDKYNIQL
ncbi:hypothetical protein IMG5_203760 [Ichthyophthirius multifiliis]|uniref:Uncharacterized protein n=1 Tax=Ichthyophthirius multifiliis TaxID=5932 RepID=G0R6D8_ICHMU|nr:hypothetical protein IMG5_203760 [Ichthyophthirius multifiliis]EGR26977.1 hypothetical protein IMG5_203760 [Ichthyophthirius multifiliis]|eukprot:XP_004023861.1 hypothetical protein IMG5_203760 [Ichthyophthirius multifiliis]